MTLAADRRLDAAARRFDFGKFGHGRCLNRVGGRGLIRGEIAITVSITARTRRSHPASGAGICSFVVAGGLRYSRPTSIFLNTNAPRSARRRYHTVNVDFLYGILNLSFWSYVIVTFLMVQFTFMGVTLYLHRDATHRSLDLHPALRHVFRFWLWMSSGIVTKEWVAVHRKHHARCETPDDPHSPVIFGLKKVLLEGAELYQVQARNPETQEKFGRGTPDDWMERNVYIALSQLRHRRCCSSSTCCCSACPASSCSPCRCWRIPLMAAGVINGIGHYYGYRNFECPDAARNIVPWGLLVAGEELHNNHHAFPSSAKFSIYRWEFDIGWLYIRDLPGAAASRRSFASRRRRRTSSRASTSTWKRCAP